jgi:hypothetical protein
MASIIEKLELKNLLNKVKTESIPAGNPHTIKNL